LFFTGEPTGGCWPIYRSQSSIEGRELKTLDREGTPPRVEALRLHAGLTLAQSSGDHRCDNLC
jgi:hypothetical protein